MYIFSFAFQLLLTYCTWDADTDLLQNTFFVVVVSGFSYYCRSCTQDADTDLQQNTFSFLFFFLFFIFLFLFFISEWIQLLLQKSYTDVMLIYSKTPFLCVVSGFSYYCKCRTHLFSLNSNCPCYKFISH